MRWSMVLILVFVYKIFENEIKKWISKIPTEAKIAMIFVLVFAVFTSVDFPFLE